MGNHEDPAMNFNMGQSGFSRQCVDRLGPELGVDVFQGVHAAFEWLPLGCTVCDQILVVHGGIGSGQWSLAHLRSARRPLDHEALHADPIIWNILWSDPLADESLDF